MITNKPKRLNNFNNWLRNIPTTNPLILVVLGIMLFNMVFNKPASVAETEEAQRLATSASTLAKSNQDRIEELLAMNKDLIKLIGLMAGQNEIALQEVNRIDKKYQHDADSLQTEESNFKRIVSDIFKEAFKPKQP